MHIVKRVPHDPQCSPLDADAITWASPPIPPVEAVDLLALTDDEVIAYARELQGECAILRQLVHDTLAMVAQLTKHLEQYRQRVARLMADIKRLRAMPERAR